MYVTDSDIDRVKTPRGGFTGKTIQIMQDFTGNPQWKNALKEMDILPEAWEALVNECNDTGYKKYGFIRSGDLLIPNEEIPDIYVQMQLHEYNSVVKSIRIYLDFLRRVQDGGCKQAKNC